MAFNKFMHPKNPYRTKKPDFKALALKYEEFRKHSTQDTGGKIHIDFKEPECLRALSWALLKDDYDLDVDMPLERLIPTIPLRLNYILWLKDIIGEKSDVLGIDVGCGASCVYPLLASKLYQWKMLTTEVDDLNILYAKRNVEKNQLGDSISVVEVKEGSGLSDLLETETRNFDFCMCNPPFFESNLEAYGLTTSRKSDRSEPKSVSTASEHESIVEGGEVAYVQQMIADSLKLKDRIRVYSTMLGKKKSVGVLKTELQAKKIKNFGSYTFCQGRTMRWGLAWSFDESVKYPLCPFTSHQKKPKPQQPLVFTVQPSQIECTVERIGQEVKKIVEDLKIEHTVVMSSKIVWSVSASAWENTWSHSRRKRREEARKKEIAAKCAKLDNTSTPGSEKTVESCESIQENTNSDSDHGVTSAEKMDTCSKITEGIEGANMDTSVNDIPEKPSSLNLTGDSSQKDCDSGTTADKNRDGSDKDDVDLKCSDDQEENDEDSEEEAADEDAAAAAEATCSAAADIGASNIKKKRKKKKVEKLPLFKCWISIRKEKPGVILEMKWMRGTSKEALHQVFQYFKNHFK